MMRDFLSLSISFCEMVTHPNIQKQKHLRLAFFTFKKAPSYEVLCLDSYGTLTGGFGLELMAIKSSMKIS